MPQILGHHHISMFAKNARQNKQFYTELLGLRLVKKTVNQDTPSMYHLFYGDEVGTPGTELTFFELPQAGHTVRGTNAIDTIGLLVPSSDSLSFWAARLSDHGLQHSGIIAYGPYEAIKFEDPDHLTLVLLSNEGKATPERWTPWNQSPVPREHAILGMGAINITVRSMALSVQLLTGLLGYTIIHQTESQTTLQAVKGEHWGEIIVTEQQGEAARPGKGSVHHLALTVADKEELNKWDNLLKHYGIRTTGVIDRYYFASLYFHDPNDILYELATDGPGFTIDCDSSELGTRLDLPPFLEQDRAAIEANLQPLD
ncbi:VOC family protein [Paenibacillus septentrionalis]|uniref:VOC family protein n=1 Tax=Paenibacillus septentrionalis TaxID=429342 RepID=A0ABW1V4N4_9BACL